MISPYIFIGVGGAGRKTLDFLHREMQHRLIDLGWDWAGAESRRGFGMPDCFQFVAIDVESNTDSDSGLDIPEGSIDRLPLARFPETLRSVYDRVDAANLGAAKIGWLPPLAELHNFNPYDGAGQIRSIGRAVVLAKLGEVETALDAAAATVSKPNGDIVAINSLLGVTVPPKPRVVLVSSLSGGSGSGIWLDIAQWLAGQTAGRAWMSQRSIGVLYLPEVFEGLPMIEGVQGNSLYGVTEFLAAAADRTAASRLSADVRQALGIGTNVTERTLRRNYFVGKTNQHGVTFETDLDVYRATAATLAALSCDHHADSFDRIGINDPQVNSLPLLNRVNVPSSAVGYGRVELGRGIFREYAKRRLRAESVRALTTPAYFGDDGSTRSYQQKIAETVARQRTSFFSTAGLNEKDIEKGEQSGGSNDQILRALLPTSVLESAIEKRTDGYVGTVDTWLGSRLRGTGLEEMIHRDRKERESELDASLRAHFVRSAPQVAEDLHRSLVLACVQYASQFSMPVLAGLLDELNAQLEAAAIELQDQAEERRNAKRSLGTALAELIGDRRRTGDDAAQRRTKSIEQVLQQRSEIVVREYAPGFIHSFRVGVVDPLRRAVRDWVRTVEAELGHRPPDVWQFDLPSELRPAPNVTVLEDVDAVPADFERVLADQFATLLDNRARRHVVQQIVGGLWDGRRHEPQDDAEGQRFFVREEALGFDLQATESRDDLRTAYGLLADGRGSTQAARFRLLGIADIERTADEWVDSVVGPFRDHAFMGIGGWLRSGDDEIGRTNEFVAGFAGAVNAAAPLVNFSLDALRQVHDQRERDDALAVIPFLPVSEQSSVAERLLVALREISNRPPSNFVSEDDTERIEIVRSIANSLHPLAMSSFTDDVLADMQRNPREFFKGRRTRPLPEAIGLTPAQLVALVRGWMIATITGDIDVERGRARIAGTWHDIPRYGLQGRTIQAYQFHAAPDRSSWLRVLLQGIPIALVEYARGRSDALDLVVALARLGGYDEGNSADTQETASQAGIESRPFLDVRIDAQELRAYIEHGSDPELATDGIIPVGRAATDHGGRREAVMQWLREREDAFATTLASEDWKADPTQPTTPEMELFPHVLAALAQLLDYVDSLDEPTEIPRTASRPTL